MTFSISGGEPAESEMTFPVVLPDGGTAFCPVDASGRIDPRRAYRPWIGPRTEHRPTPNSDRTQQR